MVDGIAGELRIGKVDAVAGICHLVALLRRFLDWYTIAHIVQARAPAEAAEARGQRTTHACGVVHPAALRSVPQRGRNCIICFSER